MRPRTAEETSEALTPSAFGGGQRRYPSSRFGSKADGKNGWKGTRPKGSFGTVTYARKILLHAPVSDEALLEPFVEQCLQDQVSIIAVWGAGSERLEDIIDEMVVGDGAQNERFVCTSSHPDEPLEDVLNMLKYWEMERDDPIQEVRL